MMPVEHNDPVNAKILAVSEDKIEGFVPSRSRKLRIAQASVSRW